MAKILNKRYVCPKCGFNTRLFYLWPSPQRDPCIERNVWRYQRCRFCGWVGDIVTGELIAFHRQTDGLLVNDTLFPGGIHDFMYTRGICPDGNQESEDVDL